MGNSTSSRQRLSDAIEVLSNGEVPREDVDFWDELWKLKTTTELAFELISPNDVRKIREKHPKNLHNLIEQAVSQLCHIIQTPLPQYHDHALNCVRVLTRIIPFILEQPADNWVKETCWSSTEEHEPLGQLAVHAVMHLLFLPGFTVELGAFQDMSGEDKYAAELNHEAKEGDDESLVFDIRFPAAAWASLADGSDSSGFDANRIEVMRLLLSMLCEPLYHPAELFSPSRDGHWSLAATAYDAPFAPILFNSLLYTVLGFDPIGWGVPYGTQVSRSGYLAGDLLQKSAQLLIVLLDFGSNGEPQSLEKRLEAGGQGGAAAEESEAPKEENQSLTSVTVKNVFVECLKRFGSDGTGNEYRAAFNGLSRLLNNVHESKNVYFPGSVYEVECYQEVLVLLWKMLEVNHSFMTFILKHCDITQLVVPICFLLFESRKDPAKVGLVHICTFILLKLSGERNFCVQLNKPYETSLPCYDFPLFTGTHSDLLVLILHKLIVNGIDKLAPLYNCFITIIANISPYTKSLCMASSVKVVSLFELFTSHRFLYAAEGNHVYVSLLLEVMNNLIQYQYSGNPHIVYAIVRRRKVFELLNALNLPLAKQHARQQHETTEQTVPTQSTNVVNTTSTLENGKTLPPEPKSCDSATPGKFVPNAQWLASVKNELPLNTILRLLQFGYVVRLLNVLRDHIKNWNMFSKQKLNDLFSLYLHLQIRKHLVPQVDELVRRSDGNIDDSTILSFLTNTTMVGLLPVPHPIVIRKYTPNLFTGLWFTAFLWGVMFLENQTMPLFDANKIKLFTVSVAN